MEAKQKTEKIVRTIIRVIAIAASVYGMSRTLTSLKFFTYFTNLSNIFVDVVLALFIFQDFVLLKNGEKRKNLYYRIKFLATVSITLTFFVYMLILAPTVPGGIWAAYFGNAAGSFCVHFATPVLAILDYILFDYEFESKGKDALFGVVPPLCYVAFVYILSALGMRWGENMTAPYNFLNYAAPVGWFGFDLSQMSSVTFGVGVFYMILVLVLIFIGLGRVFLFIKDARKKLMNK